MTRPFRFGMLSAAGDAAGWRRDVDRAEAEGWSTIVLTDHLDLSGAHVTRLSWLPAFADALARTSRLAASVMVANQDLRHPAVLAREVTTLDRLSGGRVELGLGAGHVEQEYAWAGIAFDTPRVRVDRLAEQAAVIRGLTTAGTETFSFAGEHVTITDMPVEPLPVRGRLPLVIGGSGRRVLSIAATYADVVNLNNIRDDGPADEVLARKVEIVSAAAGPRAGDLELAMSVPVVAASGDSPIAALEHAASSDPFVARLATRMPLEQLADTALVLAGTTSAIVERLLAWRERHRISYVVVPASAAGVMTPVLEQLR